METVTSQNQNDNPIGYRISRLPAGLAGLFFFLIVCPVSVDAGDPPITAIQISSDGKSLVVGSQSGIQLLDPARLTKQATWKTEIDNVHDIEFSSKGDRVAIAGGTPSEAGVVEIRGWPGGKLQQTLTGHDDSVTSVVWRNDESLVTGSLDHQIHFWHIPSKKITSTLKGHSRGVTDLLYLEKPNLLISSGLDSSLRVWELKTGQLIRSLSNHTKPAIALTAKPSRDGLPMIASASEDKTVRIWQPTIGRMVRFVRFGVRPLDVKWIHDSKNDSSRLVVTFVDGSVRSIDPGTLERTDHGKVIDGWAYAITGGRSHDEVFVGGENGSIKQILLKSSSE